MKSAREISEMLGKLFSCPRCGKLIIRRNLAGWRRPANIEAFDPRIHCACTAEEKRAYRESGSVPQPTPTSGEPTP